MELKDILNELVDKRIRLEELYSVVGKCKNISESDRTCDVEPLDGSAEILGVRLQASISSHKGVVFIPKDKSEVLVTFINKDTGFVSVYSEIAKVVGVLEDDGEVDLKVKDTRLQMNKDGIVLNGGQLEGLPVLAKVVDRLNLIEKDINKAKLAFTSWTPTPQDGGAALKGSAASWFGQQLQSTTKNDIKNDKVKQ